MESSTADARAQLVALFNDAQFAEAEIQARALTASDPGFGLGWLVLGSSIGQLRRYSDALPDLQRAVDLLPDHVEAHNQLGIALLDAGRPDDAEASCRRALAIRPDHTDAHVNLGNVLGHLGRFAEAAACYRRAVEIDPDYGVAHNNLGNALRELGSLAEAELCYRRALAIAPQDAGALNNLGTVLRAAGRLSEAEAAYRQALAIRPDYGEAYSNLGTIIAAQGRIDEAAPYYEDAHRLGVVDALYTLGEVRLYGDDDRLAKSTFEKAMTATPGTRAGLSSAVLLAALLYLEGDRKGGADLLRHANPLLGLAESGPHASHIRNMKAYHRLLTVLLSSPAMVKTGGTEQAPDRLHVIGDSHVLGLRDAIVPCRGRLARTETHWILGCKQWHLGSESPNKYKQKFASIIAGIPKHATLLLSIGEIDCRPDGGMFGVWKKSTPRRSIQSICLKTARSYVDYVARHLAAGGHQITLCGVPAVNGSLEQLSADDRRTFTGMVRYFNTTLQKFGRAAGMGFLDLYSLTDAGAGLADGYWHLDAVHLRSDAYLEAFKNHHLTP